MQRYGCKLEDIVVHVPDKKYVTSDSLPKVGTVVIVDRDISLPEHIKYFVILNIAKPQTDNVSPSFYIAPIISTNRERSFFNIKFNNVIINHEELDGYIALGKSQWVDSDIISGNFGILPNEILDKTRPILHAAVNANQ